MSDIEKRRQAVRDANVALMVALEEWKNAGAHVSSVCGALHDFTAAVLLHAFEPTAFRTEDEGGKTP